MESARAVRKFATAENDLDRPSQILDCSFAFFHWLQFMQIGHG